jgi:hypothetical protein
MNSKPNPDNGFFRTGKALAASPIFFYPALFAAVLLFVNWCFGFYQWHNDFWDCYFIARHLSFADLKTLFNPQYPIGYSSFLRVIMGEGDPTIPTIIANIGFGAILLVAAACIFRRVFNNYISLLLTMLLSLYPRLLSYCTQGGGDPGSVAFFTIGIGLLLGEILRRERGETMRKTALCSGGLFFGLSALFRYHLFVGAAMVLLCFLVFYRKEWRSWLFVGAGMCLVYWAQWTINILTGHGPFHTQFGPMNVYDLMYKLSWYQTVSLAIPDSIFKIIALDPLLFLQRYTVSLLSFAPFYLPPLIAAIVIADPTRRRLCRAIAAWNIIYFGLFSAMTSGRQALAALPLTFLTLGFLIEAAVARWGRRPLVYGVLCLICAGLIGMDIRNFMIRASERKTAESVESAVISMGCTDIRQIFSTDFNSYFKSLPPFIPYFNGGSPRWGTYLYNEEYPEFPVASVDTFAASCRARGVRYVVLNPRCSLLSKSLGELYERESSSVFIFRRRIDRFKLFETVRR